MFSGRKLAIQSLRGVRHYTAPLKDIKFVLNEVYNVNKHFENLKETGGLLATPDLVESILEETGRLASEVLAPLNVVGDRVGCTHIDGITTKTPPGFKEAYDQFVEAGWGAISYPEKYGGQGLPKSLAIVQADMTATACFTWTMYPGLSKGAINTLLAHGTEELKEKYLHKMIQGQWTGTMCLTEPQCGSDLGQVKTRAEPNGDGTYKINGTKIFISCGDHDMVDNILHCVLARLPGAPEGTKGISLFAVPKRKVNADGSLGDYNGVNIGRIEDKMGCHGSSTCEINFEDAEGVLIGTANKGLPHMFTFINTSRVGTAVQGMAAAELSYQKCLPYAKERFSMRALSGTKNPEKAADYIINHPSVSVICSLTILQLIVEIDQVRKLLMFQKAIAEGGRSMIYECAFLADEMEEAAAKGDKARVAEIDDRLGFLTPILKGYLTEMGLEAANYGIQVWGGHGYIKDNGQEQIVRDVRIASVWEGTTQIQGLDLLGRKILLGKLKPINNHCKVMYKKIWEVIGNSSGETRKRAWGLLCATAKLQLNTYRIAKNAVKDKESIGVASVDYLKYCGNITLATHYLVMEAAANRVLASGKLTEDKAFYEAKVHMSKFVYDEILARNLSLEKTMFTPTESVMGLPINSFSFDYTRE